MSIGKVLGGVFLGSTLAAGGYFSRDVDLSKIKSILPKPAPELQLAEVNEEVAKYDDGDNSLSEAESLKVLREVFDKDKNKYLSTDEVKAVKKVIEDLRQGNLDNHNSAYALEKALRRVLIAQEVAKWGLENK